LGVRRVCIGREIEPVRAFRRAKLELLCDSGSDNPSLDPERLRLRLLDEFQRHLPEEAYTSENLEQILSEHIPLGALTDLVSYTMPMDIELKQQLLAECCTEHRAQLLLEQLGARCCQDAAGSSVWKSYPPRFSDN
jgi:ATP-dependent Lon protease